MNKARRNKLFADYKQDSQNWITMANGDFYPDILPDACELYKPVLVMFGQFLKSSESSERLLEQITELKQAWMRVQLCRVFRKYVYPQTPVEMLKKKVDDSYGVQRVWQIFQDYRPGTGSIPKPPSSRRGAMCLVVGV